MKATKTATKTAVPAPKPAHVWLRWREAAAYCAHPPSTFRRDYTGERVEKPSAGGKKVYTFYRTDWLDAWMVGLDGQRRRSA